MVGFASQRRLRRRFTAERDISRAILQAGIDHDWLIMGASSPSVPRPFQTLPEENNAASPPAARPPGVDAPPGADPLTAALGAVPASVVRQAHGTVVLVRTRRAAWPEIAPVRDTAQRHVYAPTPDALSALVDKWFAENTFSAEEFTDLSLLVEKKRRQGVTISLGLPALNEEATLGEAGDGLADRIAADPEGAGELGFIDAIAGSKAARGQPLQQQIAHLIGETGGLDKAERGSWCKAHVSPASRRCPSKPATWEPIANGRR